MTGFRLFGFRADKWRQWRELLKEEKGAISARTMLYMARVLCRIGWKWLSGNKVAHRASWRAKMRACRKCPVYGRDLRRCRPYSGSKLGCGCATWLIALGQDECWGDIHLPGKVGWAVGGSADRS